MIHGIVHIEGPYTIKKSGRKFATIYYKNGRKRYLQYPRLLVEWVLGRELDPKDETVDHIDKNVRNNSLENLRVIPISRHVSEDCSGVVKKPDRRWLSAIRKAKASEQSILAEIGQLQATYRKQYGRELFDRTPRYCVGCGKKYVPTFRRQRFHSDACSRDARRKVARPACSVLLKLVWSKPTEHIAQDHGVSSSTVAKWCKYYGIQKPGKGYWSKKNAGKV